MKALLKNAVLASSSRLGPAQLKGLLAASLGEWKLALCLHRVCAQRREDELLPEFTIPADTLDALIELLLASRPKGERWLTVSFDDGYEDSAAYVLSRAPRFPQVDWLYFLCPEKAERQVGFRWDLVELRRRRGEPAELDAFMAAPHVAENEREDLREVARRSEFALASVETCRALDRLRNVELGNHTDTHLRAATVSPELFALEAQASTERFERLFGPQRHFAFPFGTPREDFTDEHVEVLRQQTPSFIWSTARRPYLPGERSPGAVLPRMVVDGRMTLPQMAAWIAVHALRERLPLPISARQAA
jgi:peptidoglycan/xylan/chitin deacetylase (PgdA/CDA1 family)